MDPSSSCYDQCMETLVSIPEPLTAATSRLARRLGISLEQLCAKAVEEYVRANVDSVRDRDITAALDRVYGGTPSKLDPGLARLQADALGRDETW